MICYDPNYFGKSRCLKSAFVSTVKESEDIPAHFNPFQTVCVGHDAQ